METDNKLPQLNPEEIRVLGSLIEKSRTTPDYYPLTLNALITACNQKSSRHPVVEYEQHTVLEAIDGLKKKMLLAHVLGDGRSVKYRHTIAVKYPLDPAEITALGLLFLRGTLTVGEIKNMSGRMYDFDDLDEVQKVLTALGNSNPPFVGQLERKPGQKEARFFHNFADVPEDSDLLGATTNPSKFQEFEERINVLETQVAELKKIIDELMS